MDIDEIKLRRLDLTVLLVFLGVMRYRKATTTAEQMGLSQSSITHSLNRLREVFDDKLFLRKPDGLEPTAFALSIEPRIRTIVESLNGLLNGPTEFQPLTSTVTLRVAMRDHILSMLLPPLLERLFAVAPNLRLSTGIFDQNDSLQDLLNGRIDMALGHMDHQNTSLVIEKLYDEDYSLVSRKSGSELPAELTLESYCRLKHLLISPNGSLTGIVDDALREYGLKRRVSVSVPLFVPALEVIAKTDLVAIIPAKMAKAFAPKFDLDVRSAPIPLQSYPVSATYHRRDEHNPIHRWFINQVKSSLE